MCVYKHHDLKISIWLDCQVMLMIKFAYVKVGGICSCCEQLLP
jgi:hypothetical protein